MVFSLRKYFYTSIIFESKGAAFSLAKVVLTLAKFAIKMHVTMSASATVAEPALIYFGDMTQIE
jgi:hypothetical protein